MIDGISAETLLADRGYDTNQIIAYAADAGMNIVIPAKRNRKQQREYDRYLYRLRHLVENAFFAPETLARRCYSICKNYNIFSGCCANSLHCYLVYCFDLILCRHYLEDLGYTMLAIWSCCTRNRRRQETSSCAVWNGGRNEVFWYGKLQCGTRTKYIFI